MVLRLGPIHLPDERGHVPRLPLKWQVMVIKERHGVALQNAAPILLLPGFPDVFDNEIETNNRSLQYARHLLKECDVEWVYLIGHVRGRATY